MAQNPQDWESKVVPALENLQRLQGAISHYDNAEMKAVCIDRLVAVCHRRRLDKPPTKLIGAVVIEVYGDFFRKQEENVRDWQREIPGFLEKVLEKSSPSVGINDVEDLTQVGLIRYYHA